VRRGERRESGGVGGRGSGGGHGPREGGPTRPGNRQNGERRSEVVPDRVPGPHRGLGTWILRAIPFVPTRDRLGALRTGVRDNTGEAEDGRAK
jgi:hypothetical protein